MDRSQTEAIFGAYATELAAIGQGIQSLEALVSDYVRQCSPEARQQVVRDAQAVDVLSQRLDAMRALAAALALGEPVASALGGVRLADLAHRLQSTILTSVPAVAATSEAGDLTLFGEP